MTPLGYRLVDRKFMKLTNVYLLTLVLFLALNMPSGAQQPTKGLPRVGVIFSFGTAADTPSPIYQAYTQGLRDLGYIEGKNIILERRYAEGRLDRMAPFVQEFVQQKVDAILGVNNVVIRAAKEATKTIPIVMISSVDPVAAGYVETFAHPGGNITGVAWLNRDISAKRIELLKELLSKLSRIGILWDVDGPGPAVAFKEYNAAAGAFKLELRSLEIRGPTPDLAGALQGAKNANTDAVIVVGNPMMSQHMKTLFPLVTKHRIPSMTEEDRYVERSEEHTSELQSQSNLVCRLLLEKKKTTSKRRGIGRRKTALAMSSPSSAALPPPGPRGRRPRQRVTGRTV